MPARFRRGGTARLEFGEQKSCHRSDNRGMKQRLAIRGVLALLVAVSTLRSASAGPPGSGDAALDKAIAAANSEWGPAMKAGDVDPIVRPYEEDGVFVTIDGSSIRGRAAIGDFYRERFRKNGLALGTKIAPRRVVVDGKLAYEWGYGEVTVRKDGKPATNGGPYLTVWRRQPDGSWKILRNVILP